MPAWTLFALVAFVTTAVFVLLARTSARALRDPAMGFRPPPAPDEGIGPAASSWEEAPPSFDPGPADESVPGLDRHEGAPAAGAPMTSTPVLLANVLATHGVLALVLLGAAWFADVPPDVLGLTAPSVETLGVGVGLGLALAGANEAGARLVSRLGYAHEDWLRGVLAPDTPAGWAGLLLLGLPVIAGAEELLFRGVLVGGLSTGLGWSEPLLVVLSSVLFGLGHSLQGLGGVVVTALLGGALAVAFLVTGSLAVVVIAHYVVNCVEFLAHEGPLGGQAHRG